MNVAWPPSLQPLARRLLAEEARGTLRHALRNRLGSIRNAAYYLRRKVENDTKLAQDVPRVPRFFRLIEDEVDAANQLIESHLPAASGVARPPLCEVALAVDLLAREGMFPVSMDWLGGPDAVLAIDSQELQVALMCLLENGCEAVGPDGAVGLAWSLQGERVRLTVWDTGPGLPPEVSARLTEPFFTTKPDHAGLGLALVRRIARRAAGELELRPRDGGGLSASLLLPLASPRLEEPSRRRALVVDDETMARFTLRALLEDEGFQVQEAGSLEEARGLLATVGGDPWELVLLDVLLGDGQGTALIPELRARGAARVIGVLSGSLSAPDGEHADLVLTKGDDPARLLGQIRRATAPARDRSEASGA